MVSTSNSQNERYCLVLIFNISYSWIGIMMKACFLLILMFAILTSGTSFGFIKVVGVPLKQAEILGLWPDYKLKLLSNHELVITSAEREILKNFWSILAVDGVGRNLIFDSEYIAKISTQLIEARKSDIHKNTLSSELDAIFEIAKQKDSEFNCSFDATQGSVKCVFRGPMGSGCFYSGMLSILVDPKTKKATGVYRSTLDSQESYQFSKNCPG
ncbi:MAG: hypothetical protein KA715_04540 [Xanthomonadaceae bacterium]|nr:hypothetical protein [Xanthomonadaceae bacterium]